MSLSQALQKTVLGLALVVPFTNALPRLLGQNFTSYNETARLEYTLSSPTAGSTRLPQGTATPNATDTCRSGNRYTVVLGDDCQKISIAQTVNTRELILINSLRFDCLDLLGGQDICLPEACKTYTVQVGDDCTAIAAKQGTTFNDILSWNPTIDFQCGNLIGGDSICISPPAGGVSNPTNTTSAVPVRTPPPVVVNGTATAITDSVAGSTSPVQPPGPTPPGTESSNCFEYHTVISGDYCSLIATQYGTTFERLRELNPQLNAECTNLLLGVSYCVKAA